MSVAFLTRPPNEFEVEHIRLAMSVFCDGFGQERERDGSSRPGWRDFERIIADVLNGIGTENKEIFDVFVQSTLNNQNIYGISLKSKELSRKTAIDDLSGNGRVYMELCNSPAKLWSPIKAQLGLDENIFRNMHPKDAQDVGDCLLTTINSWHSEAKNKFENSNPNLVLDLPNSKYLTISYSRMRDECRYYQIHAFNMHFPQNIMWEFLTNRCLRGFDPTSPAEALFDWYGLSGGQLKYYPKASTAIFNSIQFTLEKPKYFSPTTRAKIYWPDKW